MTVYPALLTTDLHLTANVNDAYRWTIFDQLHELRRKHKARTLIICGDLTDAKDNHSATLVNSIVESLASFADSGCEVIVLQGNHDYLLAGNPFFEFLNQIDKVQFVSKPCALGPWVFIPHSRVLPLPGLELISASTTHCFMHQTLSGAKASNGQQMQGELTSKQLPHRSTCKYYSGDIHVPQFCGDVEYVGSPYPVHFGDTFKPRVLVLEDEEDVLVRDWEGLRRVTTMVSSADELSNWARKGDQLKVRLALSRQDMPEWHERKREVQAWCDRRGVKLVSVELQQPSIRKQLRDDPQPARHVDASPAAVLARYVKDRGVAPDVADAGLSIIEEVRK